MVYLLYMASKFLLEISDMNSFFLFTFLVSLGVFILVISETIRYAEFEILNSKGGTFCQGTELIL
jgi:hypothetical protein